jgi:hypothetical protein
MAMSAGAEILSTFWRGLRHLSDDGLATLRVGASALETKAIDAECERRALQREEIERAVKEASGNE